MDGFIVDVSPPPAAAREIFTYTLTGDRLGLIAVLLVAAILTLAVVALSSARH